MPKIYVSPSCQEKNNGVGTYNEERVMNLLADKLIECLKRNGFDTERNDPNYALAQVVQEANNYGPSLHVALHSNAYNQKARGMEIWHNPVGITAAKTIYEVLDPIIPCKNRGIKLGSALYELNSTKHPTILIEYDFHDTADGALFILSNLDLLAEKTAEGICLYSNIPYKGASYTHWAEKSFNKLNELGLKINDKRFDEPLKRGEAFALIERLLELIGPNVN